VFCRQGQKRLDACQTGVLNRIKTVILRRSLKAISQNDITEFKENAVQSRFERKNSIGYIIAG